MKYLIVSDLHGGLDGALKIKELINKIDFDKILLLGDILYHGPRNDLPLDYKPKEVIKILNEYSNKIICIKGNCDAEVDQMVLDFKIIESLDITLNNISIHLEHGHHLDLYNGNHELIMYGHTHIYDFYKKDNSYYFNPGSITLPKNNNPKTYAILDNDVINLYDIENNLKKSYKILKK